MIKKDEDSQYLNQLVRELTDVSNSETEVENFDHVSYIIKQVFETEREVAFTDSLSKYVTVKNSEIESVCSIHYQEFVQSIDQLLKVRTSTNSFKNEILELNSQVQNAGQKLVEKKKEIIETRRTLLNVELALETMHSCLFILDMANKVQTRVENGKYYTALKLLETLEEKHLKNMKEFSFVQKMIDSIPVTQEIIRTAVLREMRDWFLTLKDSTNLVGKEALRLALQKNLLELEKYTSDENVGESNLENSQDLIFDTDSLIDFTPLHQCIHIHDFLGKGSLLKMIYDENRRLQAEDHLKRFFTFKNGNYQEFQEYMEGIAGFFIIETVVMESTRDFRSRHQVEQLWDISTTKLLKIISDSLYECPDPDIILDIKQTVVSFIHTMQIYGYLVGSLMDLMVSLLDTWAKLVKLAYTKNLIEVLDEDDYSPMTIKNKEEYEAIKFGYPNIAKEIKKEGKIETADDNIPRRGRNVQKETSQIRYPVDLPYSRSFPASCSLIRRFIGAFFSFAEGFQQQSHEIDDMLKKSLENILVQSLNGTLLRILSKGTISIAIQIFINAPYWIKACEFFEDLLMERRPQMAARVVLQATQAFDDTRAAAEKRIHEIICQKMDEFLEMEDYNWTTTSLSFQPSAYLEDLANYLRAIGSSSLTALPETMHSSIYREAFAYFSQTLLSYLSGPVVKKISFEFLTQLSADLKYIESLIKQDYPYLQEEEMFLEMIQLINFVQLGEYDAFFDAAVRAKKYSKFRTQTLILVMEKFREEISFFSSISLEQRNRSKKIEAFILALKAKYSATTK